MPCSRAPEDPMTRIALVAAVSAALSLAAPPVRADEVAGDEMPSVQPAATAAPPAPADTRPRPVLVQHGIAGKQPTTCTLSKDGRTLYVANRGDNSVSLLDPDTLEVRRTITDVGYGAWGLAEASPATLLVSNWTGSGIAVLDLAAGKRAGEVPAGMNPSYLALSADGARVYSSGKLGGEATIGDVASRKLVKTIPDVGRKPMGVALSRDG